MVDAPASALPAALASLNMTYECGAQDIVGRPWVSPEGGGSRGHRRPLCQVAVAHHHQQAGEPSSLAAGLPLPYCTAVAHPIALCTHQLHPLLFGGFCGQYN